MDLRFSTHAQAKCESTDRKLTVLLPNDVLRQLRTRMAENDTTMRALVLEALASAGYTVDAAQIRDRRRHEKDRIG